VLQFRFIKKPFSIKNKSKFAKKNFMSITNVDKQIDSYLSQLSITQKKTVLMVVKTIALAHGEYDTIWEDKEFVMEMDKRTEEYENGTAKLYKFEDMKKKAVANYKAKSSRKK